MEIQKHHRPGAPRQLELKIENQLFYTDQQYWTGTELKAKAGIPMETELFLSIQKPYQDELIENDTRVNLARPETEYFYVKKKLLYTINKVEFTSYKQYIRGSQIREQGKISPEDEIYLDNKEGWEDDPILDDEFVDLARPGKEHFYSKRIGTEIILIINGRDRSWSKKTISFAEVIHLKDGTGENGSKAYTITYTDGHPQNPSGEMAKGEVVRVKNQMRFYVTATDKS
ncbi:multiubiquitin domain-containing protein [Rhodocytophaga aerolata]|uniref:Multiubiquitin domain-containing protein n=1 Tax=Rhodocytophaga aerolata TaxID=455078 RepID=A0ABT8RE54_9BACT|nr:multiubiquitin domain-containing protein [Rhodocytophaga aerolata]MDO1449513.1 multiubiquitin domain-containing protein [Rhodocytophaga aerolata]